MDQVFLQRSDKGLAAGLQPHAIVNTGVIHQRIDAAEGLLRLCHRPSTILLFA
ncbi:hypothetical protein D3C76_1644080 [compost metagenome]